MARICAFTAEGQFQFLFGELRFHQLCVAKKKKKKILFINNEVTN